MPDIITTTPPQPTFPQQNRFTSDKAFDNLIWDKAYNVYLEHAVRCPCCEKTTNQPTSLCQNCGGSGWLFIDKTQTRLLLQGISYNAKYRTWTETNTGTMSVTARFVDKLGYMDRITMIDGVTWFSQIIRPQMYANNLFAFLVYIPIDMLSVYLYETPNKPLKLLTTSDYSLISNRIIINAAYNKIPNLTLSVRYTHNPVYNVLDITRDIILQRTVDNCANPMSDMERNFPVHAIAKRTHYLLDALNADGVGLFSN